MLKVQIHDEQKPWGPLIISLALLVAASIYLLLH
jgi:hypothetical protein